MWYAGNHKAKRCSNRRSIALLLLLLITTIMSAAALPMLTVDPTSPAAGFVPVASENGPIENNTGSERPLRQRLHVEQSARSGGLRRITQQREDARPPTERERRTDKRARCTHALIGQRCPIASHPTDVSRPPTERERRTDKRARCTTHALIGQRCPIANQPTDVSRASAERKRSTHKRVRFTIHDHSDGCEGQDRGDGTQRTADGGNEEAGHPQYDTRPPGKRGQRGQHRAERDADRSRSERLTLRVGFQNSHGRCARPAGVIAAHTFAADNDLDALFLTETWSYHYDMSMAGSRYEHVRGYENPRAAGRNKGGRLTGGLNALVRRDGAWRWTATPQYDSEHSQWFRARSTAANADGLHVNVYVASVYIPGSRTRNGGDNNDARENARQELTRSCAALRRITERDSSLNASTLLIGGDMNGRLSANGDTETNDAGMRIREFCATEGLEIANEHTCATGQFSFTGRRAPERTDGSTRPLYHTTPDFVLTDAHRDVMELKAFAIADDALGSDHKPLIAVLETIAACNAGTAAAATHPTERARRPTRRDDPQLIAALDSECKHWLLNAADTDTDTMVKSFTALLQRCARIATDPQHRDQRKPERRDAPSTIAAKARASIQHAARTLRNARRRNDTAAAEAASKLLLRLHATRRRAARAVKARQLQRDAETLRNVSRDPAALWQWLHRSTAITRRSVGRRTARGIHALTREDGTTTTDATEILEIVRHHFDTLSATPKPTMQQRTDRAALLAATETQRIGREREDSNNSVTSQLTPTQPDPITTRELVDCINTLKNNKAPGTDGTYPELLKMYSPQLVIAIKCLLNRVCADKRWPTEWGKGTIVPIPKAHGDRTRIDDHRGISLRTALSKLLEKVLNGRVMDDFEERDALHDSQYGFRPNRSTIDAALLLYETAMTVRQNAADERARNQRARNGQRTGDHPTRAVFAFLDVKKAYDHTQRDAIVAQLRAHGMQEPTAQLIESMLRPGQEQRTVTVNGQTSQPFAVDVGVPQGAVLSPLLYNTFIDSLPRALYADKRQFGLTIGGARIACLLYADDIVLIAKSRAEMQQMLDVCAKHARQWTYEFNPTKCKALAVGKKELARDRGKSWFTREQHTDC